MGEEPEIAVVGTKGQIVIPQQIRDDLNIKPKTKLALYQRGDKIVVTKLEIPPLTENLKELFKACRREHLRGKEKAYRTGDNERDPGAPR